MSEIDIGGIENCHPPFQGKGQPFKEAPIILFVLAICSFGIGTTEFVIAGLLKILAADLNVSIPAAGWVMTSYALSVTIGAPLITALTIHLRRKSVLSGLFAAFSYIAPLLINVTHFTQSDVAYLLVLFGLGLMIGNFLGGKLADKSLKATLYATLFLLSFTLLIFVWTAYAKWPAAITLFLLGIIGFATVPSLQMQVVHRAKAAPTLSSSTNIAAFNLGISLSIFLGGLGISFGFGYTSPSWIGALLTFTAFLIAVFLNNKYEDVKLHH